MEAFRLKDSKPSSLAKHDARSRPGHYYANFASIFSFSCAGENHQKSVLEESGDAPGKLWDSTGFNEQWQIISPNNTTTVGAFSLNDSVDVFALQITSTNWTMVGFWVSDNESVRITVQRLNQTTWTIEEFADGSDGELGLDPGTHAIRLERNGDFEDEGISIYSGKSRFFR